MLTRLALSRIAACKSLSRVQRKFVFNRCIRPLLMRWAYRKLFFLLSILGAAAIVQKMFGSWSGVVLFTLVVLFGTDMFDLMIVVFHRQQIEKFIQGHEAEIRAVS